MKKILITVTALLAMATTSISSAQSADGALAAVKESVSVVLADLKANKAKYKANPSLLNDMVDEKMVPYFDIDVMAKYVLGKSWKKASKSQQKEFISSFKKLIMRTYSVALLDYSDAKVEYGEPRAVKKGRTKVKATVINSDNKKFPLELSMRYKAGKWKAYDVSMDGLSVITSYRGSVGEEVANKGLDVVISEIKELNAKGKTKK